MSDEFSENELRATLACVDEWYQAFARTPGFAQLSVPHQQEAESILELFAHYAYDPCPCGSGKKYKFCCRS